MAEQRKDGASLTRADSAQARRARLEQEIRANLLKRKAQGRARKASATPRDEGGQTSG